MEAKEGNIVAKERQRLDKVLPLRTPYTIAIDPCNLCNFKCNFCAMQVNEEIVPYKKCIMSMELFTKIIDDISCFEDKLKVLRINGQGEPLLNRNFSKMVKYAKQKGVADWIETITNGSMLEPMINKELVDSGIDRIRISIEALDAEGYRNIAGVQVDIDKMIHNIEDLYKRSRGKMEIYIKTVNVSEETEKKRKQFYEMFGNICAQIFEYNVIPLWSDFDKLNKTYSINKEVGVHGQVVKNVDICPYPFYSFIINADGEVTLCCADWKRRIVIGDARKQSVVDIWNSEEYKHFLKKMLAQKRQSFDMCKKCLLPVYDCNDNIDEQAKVLLEKYQ